MLAFGDSVIRLADIARHGGRAAEAASELWPLITRLETRIACGHAEPEAVRLLAQARVSFGVTLGHLLPEEQMATAARWTGRALRLAWDLGDRTLLASVLRMHGNELRKAGHAAAAMTRLRQSLQLNDHPGHGGAALVLLARAAAESGHAELFDTVTRQCVQALKADDGHEVFFNAFTVREVRIRGLLAAGRTAEAVDLVEVSAAEESPPTPQWRVIERVTTADALVRVGDEDAAASMLSAALSDAETLRLPHQVQRVIRLTDQSGGLRNETVRTHAQAALTRLERQLTEATSTFSTSRQTLDRLGGSLRDGPAVPSAATVPASHASGHVAIRWAPSCVTRLAASSAMTH
jgi:hypothetical protein